MEYGELDQGYAYAEAGELGEEGEDVEPYYEFGELLAAPLDPHFQEAITVLQFDQQYEALWAGTESGMLYTLQCPLLTRYASWQAHEGPVLDLQLLGDCAISVSAARAALTTSGGHTRAAAVLGEEGESWMSAVVEPGTGSSRLLIAGASGHIYVHDLLTSKVTKQPTATASDGLALLRGPVGRRGAVAAGTAGGRVLLVDARAGWQPSSSTLAHAGGLSALEVQGDLLATAGFSRRMGQAMAENCVKVFDARSVLRPLFTMPCAAPCVVAWHPNNSMTLLAAAPTGLFVLADPSNPTAVETYQVDTGGDGLRCGAISPSGEAVAFGGSGGYAHLWAASATPRTTPRGHAAAHLVHPPRKEPGARAPGRAYVSEGGPLSALPSPHDHLLADAAAAGATSAVAAAAAVAGVRLLSDVPDITAIAVGRPPRVVDAALKKDMHQVDFIGYIPNPHFSRSKAPGAARAAAAPLQHKRVPLAEDRSGAEAARAARVQSRLARGGALLPARYRRLVIRPQAGVRFEEFDFSYYNKTRFAGLENDLPNCYCNALLQVLYFTPSFRAAVLAHVPEPGSEFCLACELLFLFKMLLTPAGGLPCQALNLLRALKQNREAAALGLLEGTIGAGALPAPPPGGAGAAGGGAGGAGAGEPGDGGARGHEWGARAGALAAQSVLPKRVVMLCRFLLDHLFKEAGGEAAATAHSDAAAEGGDGAGLDGGPDAAGGGAADKEQQQLEAAGEQPEAPLDKHALDKGGRGARGGRAQGKKGGRGKGGRDGGAGAAPRGRDGGAQPSALAGVIQELFGLTYRSDMAALSGPKKGCSKSRQLKTFQVDLAYPEAASSSSSSSSRAGRSSGAGAAAQAGAPAAAGGAASPLASPVKAGRPGDSPAAGAASAPTSPLPAGASPGPGARGGGGGVPGLSLGPGAGERPSFGGLLANSLRAESVTKAWFDESCGYAHVRQSRVPLALPKVLAINCAMTSPAQAALWEPSRAGAGAPEPATPPAQQQQQQRASDASGGGGGDGGGGAADAAAEQPWLPWVLQVRSDPATAQVDVLTADSVEELQESWAGVPAAPVQATYELTALVCHIVDEDDADAASNGAGGVGGLTSSASAAALAGLLSQGGPGARGGGGGGYQGHAVAVLRVQPPYLDPALPGGLHRFGSAVGHNPLLPGGSGIPGAGAQGGGGGGGGGAAGGFSLPDDLDDVFAELAISPQARSGEAAPGLGGSDDGSADGGGDGGADGGESAGADDDDDGDSPGAAAAAAQQQQQQQQQQQWVVINDFSISAVPAAEVRAWYDGQKLPCLLFYTQVAELEAARELPPPLPPAPVDAQTFAALCAAPPLQGPGWRGRRSFTPLEFPREAPRPGFLVAVDAEFVAVARAETSLQGGVEVQLKPSRLALARVSVLRGSGPAAGSAFIDDYVACVEPVVDYLTRWSGIRPGDLDPSTSPHHVVSLKTAYLKLHHLLDAGAVFVGHGLRQDFRVLNLTVPPEQVRDTVELFSFRRQRKLSLRFLASYLLGLTIQQGGGAAGAAAAAAAAAAAGRGAPALGAGAAASPPGGAGRAGDAGGAAPRPGGGHDSIEDAATALALYHVYVQLQARGARGAELRGPGPCRGGRAAAARALPRRAAAADPPRGQAEGRLEEKLHEMYAWGKVHGWEPVTRDASGALQPPAAPVLGAP
ncbi:Pan2 [Scenedesmus sp. PABB004]|nr:Pan2 [Scenedesmus sp. PABB004]